MPTVESENRRQVEELNQRGGRTLSMADLLHARTITPEAAAYVGRRLSQGGSVITAAQHGGAGKTALLAALLGFLPENLPLVTVETRRVLARAAQTSEPHCYLVHEIGAGHWYGYLWGSAVADYLALAQGPHRIATCLHADTYEELREQLTAPPLGASPEDLAAVDLLLFIQLVRAPRGSPSGRWHRVTAIYEKGPAGGAQRLVFTRDADQDALRPVAGLALDEEAEHLARFLQWAQASGPYDWEGLRRECLRFRDAGRTSP